MKKLILAATLILPALSSASASNDAAMGTTAFTTMSPYMTVVSPTATTIERSKLKVILAAREDAAAFIASEGAIETARLQEAFQIIREANQSLQVSNMDLANFIVSIQ